MDQSRQRFCKCSYLRQLWLSWWSGLRHLAWLLGIMVAVICRWSTVCRVGAHWSLVAHVRTDWSFHGGSLSIRLASWGRLTVSNWLAICSGLPIGWLSIYWWSICRLSIGWRISLRNWLVASWLSLLLHVDLSSVLSSDYSCDSLVHSQPCNSSSVTDNSAYN